MIFHLIFFYSSNGRRYSVQATSSLASSSTPPTVPSSLASVPTPPAVPSSLATVSTPPRPSAPSPTNRKSEKWKNLTGINILVGPNSLLHELRLYVKKAELTKIIAQPLHTSVLLPGSLTLTFMVKKNALIIYHFH